ncbi:MAG TPA: BrnT family toxin [Tepidisphaeraceae bacterium]|nr:BrnT family toxin [Tepidisphaeraceae bacterium]
MSKLRIVWHSAKAAANLRKHRVSFDEAKTVLDDPDVLIKPDFEHSEHEDRAQAVGLSGRLRILFVVFVELERETIRLISARRATATEAATYAKQKEERHKR